MTVELPAGMGERLARIALGHVERAYPHGLQHVFAGPEEVVPSRLHPVFFGSFDWHSCVHGYWLLAALLRRGVAVGAISALFERRLTADGVAGECAYFARGTARGFERPYGWGWVLALHHALRGTVWGERVRPLAEVIAGRFRDYLPLARYPVRVGTHFNSAFALTLAAPWAGANDPALLGMMAGRVGDWYGGDRDCQAWEPSQDDFLSPALTEAVCVQALRPEGFAGWFAGFLPGVGAGRPATLFVPAEASDRTDGKIAHLDGLNLSRAWCWTRLGVAGAAEAHLRAALPFIEGDFMGEHWLGSFAMLALVPDALE